jgi:hypothetical protein
MRILNAALTAEFNRLESDHVITMLAQVDILGAPVPYRLANYDQDIAFHGLAFLRASFDVDSLEEATSASLVHVRVSIGNVNQEMQSLLENYWASVADPQWLVTLWTIDAMQPDLTPFSAGEVYSIQNIPTDLVTAQPDMIVEGLTLSRVVPRRRYTKSGGFASIARR